MLDDASDNALADDPGTQGRGAGGDGSLTVVIDSASDDGSGDVGDVRRRVSVGLESKDKPDSIGDDSFSVDVGDNFSADEDELPVGDADEHELGFRAVSEDFGALDADLSPWAPLLGMLDTTEPEESPGDRPFTPSEQVERAHAPELRAEPMLQHTAHYIPRSRCREPTHETGLGRLSQDWNQFPLSHRERILNTLSKGEAPSPDRIAARESGLEGDRAAEGRLPSSRYRATADGIADPGDPHRRARWHMHGWRGRRLLQLTEMLDYATVVV